MPIGMPKSVRCLSWCRPKKCQFHIINQMYSVAACVKHKAARQPFKTKHQRYSYWDKTAENGPYGNLCGTHYFSTRLQDSEPKRQDRILEGWPDIIRYCQHTKCDIRTWKWRNYIYIISLSLQNIAWVCEDPCLSLCNSVHDWKVKLYMFWLSYLLCFFLSPI